MTKIQSGRTDLALAFSAALSNFYSMDPTWTGRQKLIYAAMTTVMFAAVMIALGLFIRPYTDGFVRWLDGAVGKGPAGWLILGAIPVGYFLLWASGHFNDASPSPTVKRPAWFKLLAVIVLAPPVIGLAVIVGVEVFR